jgi:predicted transcriptional regulator
MSIATRATTAAAARVTATRSFVTSVKEAATADDALRFSGYSAIDFTIPEDAPVYDAVQKFAAFNIGCLVTVDTAGM